MYSLPACMACESQHAVSSVRPQHGWSGAGTASHHARQAAAEGPSLGAQTLGVQPPQARAGRVLDSVTHCAHAGTQGGRRAGRRGSPPQAAHGRDGRNQNVAGRRLGSAGGQSNERVGERVRWGG